MNFLLIYAKSNSLRILSECQSCSIEDYSTVFDIHYNIYECTKISSFSILANFYKINFSGRDTNPMMPS